MKLIAPPAENPGPAEKKRLLVQLAQAGRLEEAKNLGRALCKQLPSDPETWYLLGAVHGGLSEYPEAEACSRKALALAPDHLMINFNLAVTLVKQGKTDEATALLEKCTRLKPDYADAWLELANIQNSTHQYLGAIRNYRKAIALAPGSALACFNLGAAHRNLRQLDEAEHWYARAVELDPRLHDAWIELSLVSQERADTYRERDTLEAAARHLPGSADIQYRLGVVCQNLGEAETALRHYENTLRISSDHTGARVGIAGILGLRGRYQESGEQLTRILEAHPENVPATITLAHYAAKLHRVDEAIRRINALLERPDLPDSNRADLHLSLASLYEKRGDPDLAFSQYQTGNRLKHAHFDGRATEDMFHELMQAFAVDRVPQLPVSGIDSDLPVFIVGMPRSGTSLVEQILASHPAVHGAGELPLVGGMVNRLPAMLDSDKPYFRLLDRIDAGLLERLAAGYLDDIRTRAGSARRVTDKMPTNFIHLGLIGMLFPGARVIHCVRDPLDTCLSCYFQNFRGHHPYACDLRDLGRFYRLYQRLMAHWKQVLRLPVLEVAYEDLILHQEARTRELLGFCGLDWDPACLRFHETARTVATASHEQVRQPVYVTSIGRWRTYEKHLGPLLDALNLQRTNLPAGKPQS